MSPKKPIKKNTKTRARSTAILGVKAPRAIDNPIDLADWLELVALTSDDRNASKANLFSLLNRAGHFHPSSGKDKQESLCLEAFSELESRQIAAGEAYPFDVSPPLVSVREDVMSEYPAYVFCLCLSAWRWMRPTERPQNARQLFEHLSSEVARNYVGGEVVRFASPRDKHISRFAQAIDYVCEHLGEGDGFPHVKSAEAKKDDTLDIIAWRQFPDRRSGKLVLLGNCASGGDWKGKLAELQPADFAKLWFERPPVSQLLKAIFVPHRLGQKTWDEVNVKAGLTFDRCRLSYWASQGSLERRAELVAWYQSVIA